MNAELCVTRVRGMFVTITIGVIDIKTGQINFSNAGHLPLVLRSSTGEYTHFPAKSPPLGILNHLSKKDFPEEQLVLQNGSVYIFSDGVIEAKADGVSELGVKGLETLIDNHMDNDKKSRTDRIFSKLNDESQDDMTMMVLQL